MRSWCGAGEELVRSWCGAGAEMVRGWCKAGGKNLIFLNDIHMQTIYDYLMHVALLLPG